MKRRQKKGVAVEVPDGPADEPTTGIEGAAQGLELGDTSDGDAAKEAASEKDPAVSSERFLRLQADFENFRKRTQRERAEISRHANEEMMLELLPVLDHLDLGLDAAREHKADAAFLDGLQMVADQLLTALGKFGLTVIETEGGTFDPNMHEAISYIPADDVDEGGIVTQTRKGYLLGDKLLRAAQVVVSSGAAAQDPPEGEAEEARGSED